MLKRLFSSHKKTGDKRKVKKRVAEIVGVLALGILISVNIFTTYAGTAPAAPIGTEGYFWLYIDDVTDATNKKTSAYKIHLNPYNTDGSAVWSNKAYETKVSQEYVGGPNAFDFSVTAGTAKEDGWAAVDPGLYRGTRYFVIPINIDVRSVNGNSEIYIKDEIGFENTTDENGSDLNTLHAQHELGSAHMTIELDTNNVDLTRLHAGGKETNCRITIKIAKVKP